MKFIRHSGGTTQYNTMQSNVKKQKKKKKEKEEKSELKHAYTSTERTRDNVMKISKNFFSNIIYITLSSNHVILKHQKVELLQHTKKTITCSHYNTLHPANPRPENQFMFVI